MGDMLRAVRAELSGVTPRLDAQEGNLCEICGRPRSQRSDFWCSRRCKDESYNRRHPVVRQSRLDFRTAEPVPVPHPTHPTGLVPDEDSKHHSTEPPSQGSPARRQGQGSTARLDFTPAASELAHAIRGRETKAQRILARLRQGPATTWELAQVGGIRFGARLDELKAAGMRWEREDHADYSVYTMTQEPRGE